MGTGLAGDTLVPTEYKATATYSSVFSKEVPIRHITKANYRGTVKKTEVVSIQCPDLCRNAGICPHSRTND